ncbi:MAG TPA: AsmA-like C-terminal region-containing protein [Acidobacteriaceae bacterium]|nr:AsmA-like C-terminal region-containing protein [Acidobacteriaceae bacterium]
MSQESFSVAFASDGEVIHVQDIDVQRPGLSKRRKVAIVILAFGAGLLIAGLIAAQYAIHHAEPMLRARVIQTLSVRFNSQVQLGEFHVSVLHGLNVEGKNLSLRSNLEPSLPPQIQVDQFSFHTPLLDVFRSPMHIGLVQLNGMQIMIPPKGQRTAMPKPEKSHGKISLIIDKIVCDQTTLTIMTNKSNKVPLQFEIHALTLTHVGSKKPMHFVAQLVNAKPLGNIATTGNFGPWNADEPSDTPVNGSYSFTHADLSTTHGIAGMLSSQGKYSGQLDTITVDGTTDTPDFSVDVSGHKVDLKTQFHAIVNGTNGNTYLRPVKAHFLHTDLTASGDVVRAKGQPGHDIHLDVTIHKGRIEDLLQLGVKTDPPVMTGNVQLKTKFYLPPGSQPVNQKLQLKGTFAVENVSFTNDKVQKKMDQLSLRSRGKAAEAKDMDNETGVQLPGQQDVQANMNGVFDLANGKLRLPQLVCTVPGAEIRLAGVYTLDGREFDFTGHARMQASVSSIVGGWKGMLLTPLDPFFSKHGAGTELPIKITGTKADPHFGLNY